jgi:hypothetical protein
MGVAPQAFFRPEATLCGASASDLRELRQLREENRKLKTLVSN